MELEKRARMKYDRDFTIEVVKLVNEGSRVTEVTQRFRRIFIHL